MRRCTTPTVLPSHKRLQSALANLSVQAYNAMRSSCNTAMHAQVYDTSSAAQPQGPAGVKVKASQCFTKVRLCYNQWAMVQMASFCL